MVDVALTVCGWLDVREREREREKGERRERRIRTAMALPLARLVVRRAQSLASSSCSAAPRVALLPTSSLSPIASVDAAAARRRLAASQSSSLRRSFKESRVVGFPVEVCVQIS